MTAKLSKPMEEKELLQLKRDYEKANKKLIKIRQTIERYEESSISVLELQLIKILDEP